MKIKLKTVLKDVDGVTSLSTGKGKEVLILKEVCINSILTPSREDREQQKFQKWELFKKIRDCKTDEIDLKAEEIVILKRSIGEIQPPLIMGQAFEMLEK